MLREANLDTEEWGSLYIGCAGGIDYDFNKDLELTDSKNELVLKLSVSKFIGGHSGLDIHHQRGNANKVLATILQRINKEVGLELENFRCGKAHNIIPRDGFTTFRVDKDKFDQVEAIINEYKVELKSFLPKNDQNFEFMVEKLDFYPQKVLSKKELNNILTFMTLFPHGAHSYDLNNREITSTSNNMAITIIMNGKLYVLSSLRFFDRNEIKDIEQKHGDDLVEIKAHWPDWWTDGFASGAREVAAARNAHVEMIASQGGLAMAKLLGAKMPSGLENRIFEANKT
mgnify:CR=1 FL=1